MKQSEFNSLCGELLIDPSIALENDNVRDVLANRESSERIREILETEF
jgi:hypothetical protein